MFTYKNQLQVLNNCLWPQLTNIHNDSIDFFAKSSFFYRMLFVSLVPMQCWAGASQHNGNVGSFFSNSISVQQLVGMKRCKGDGLASSRWELKLNDLCTSFRKQPCFAYLKLLKSSLMFYSDLKGQPFCKQITFQTN